MASVLKGACAELQSLNFSNYLFGSLAHIVLAFYGQSVVRPVQEIGGGQFFNEVLRVKKTNG
jgi:hypothetical protein